MSEKVVLAVDEARRPAPAAVTADGLPPFRLWPGWRIAIAPPPGTTLRTAAFIASEAAKEAEEGAGMDRPLVAGLVFGGVFLRVSASMTVDEIMGAYGKKLAEALSIQG